MPAHRSLARGGLSLLLIGLAVITACNGDDEPDPDPTSTTEPAPSGTAPPVTDIALVASDAPRNAADAVETGSVADATNAFAADLYAVLAAANGDDNLVFSPYSAAVALAMTGEGARGDTAAEMDAVLHADLAGGDLAAGFNGLEQAHWRRSPASSRWATRRFTLELSTANQLFGQAGFGFDQSFLDTARGQLRCGHAPRGLRDGVRGRATAHQRLGRRPDP